MNYWSECEKCKRATVSRTGVVCHRCETGEPPLPPPRLRFIGDRWLDQFNEENENTVIGFNKGEAVRYRDILSVNVMNDGKTWLQLNNGDSLVVSNGSFIP